MSDNTALVSIITPCFNSGKFIHRLLDSVLSQTYEFIEMIIVDDGSTDNTSAIVNVYRELFEKRNFTLKYFYQENQGQAAALNFGLKVFTGNFLTWPDSDDFYNENASIEKMVKALRDGNKINSNIGAVRVGANLLDENSLHSIGQYIAKDKDNVDLFYNVLLENDFWFSPICFLFSTEAIKKCIPDLSIYISRGGQNWQIYLPVFYVYKCLYFDEKLVNYLVRPLSHSRNTSNSWSSSLNKSESHQEIILNTIERMNFISFEEKNRLKELIGKKYMKKNFISSIKYSKKRAATFFSYILIQNYYNTLSAKEKLLIRLSKNQFIFNILNKKLN